MQSKLQELTEKIYQEGVQKASEEAEKILVEARHQAEEIIKEAHKQAGELVKGAEKQTAEMQHNTMSELKLSGRQVMTDIKQQIMNMIDKKVLEGRIKESVKDENFIKEVIATAIKNWNPKSDEAISLELLLPKEKQDAFDNWFKSQAKELLDSGLKVEYSGKVKAGFQIGPKDGGYFISFTDQDFDSLFKSYMRPKLVELLFEKE